MHTNVINAYIISMIHLIAAGKYENRENWPIIWEKCYQSIEKLGYKIKIWNDKEINHEIKSEDEEFYNKYLVKLDPVYRWDYVRYIILERYPGAYFDMDIEIVRDFLPMLNNKKIYIAEGSRGEYVSNCIMISPWGAEEAWRVIREWMKRKIIDNFSRCLSNKKYTMWTVGPLGLSQYLSKYKDQWGVFNLEILGWHQFSSLTNELAYTRHHHTGEWFDEDMI